MIKEILKKQNELIGETRDADVQLTIVELVNEILSMDDNLISKLDDIFTNERIKSFYNESDWIIKNISDIYENLYTIMNDSNEFQMMYADLSHILYLLDHYLYGWSYNIPSSNMDDPLKTKFNNEAISYVFASYPEFIRYIPNEKITYDVCLDAINKSNKVIKIINFIPRKYFDDVMCLTCVYKDLSSIRKIPMNKITLDFAKSLIDIGVDLTTEISYIKKCISKNEGIEYNDEILYSNTNKNTITSKSVDILIDDCTDLLSKQTINILKRKDINNLNELFYLYDSGRMAEIFDPYKRQYSEMMGVTRLLKCKYLDVDPMIDENSNEKLEDILNKMGLPLTIMRSLTRAGYFSDSNFGKTVSDFFAMVRSNDFEDLLKVRSMGQGKIDILTAYARIVTDYHDNHINDLENNDDMIVMLSDENKRLDNEINVALSKNNIISKEKH